MPPFQYPICSQRPTSAPSRWQARVAALAWLLCVAQATLATEIRRCRLADGRVQVSDGLCPPGSRELSVRNFQSAAAVLSEEARARLTDTQAWQRHNRAEVAAWVRANSARPGRATRRSAAPDVCEQARKRRDRIRDREFKRMTFDRAVALDDEVREQCRR